MISQTKIKQQFYKHLSDTFGPGFTDMIESPEGIKIGERVLYKLIGQREARRSEMMQNEIDELNQIMAGIAEKFGGALAETRPPVSSGLPYPRVIDIIGWLDLAMNTTAQQYIVSDDLLPKTDFSIEWLFGAVFTPSDKQLLYFDFTHPKIKTAFSAHYDCEYDFDIGQDINQQLQQFKKKRNQIIDEIESRPEIMWVKLVQLDNQVFTSAKQADKSKVFWAEK